MQRAYTCLNIAKTAKVPKHMWSITLEQVTRSEKDTYLLMTPYLHETTQQFTLVMAIATKVISSNLRTENTYKSMIYATPIPS